MDHIRKHIDHPREVLVGMIDNLHGDNAEAMDFGGTNRQSLDAFTSAMWHTFLLKRNDLFFEFNGCISSANVELTSHRFNVIRKKFRPLHVFP